MRHNRAEATGSIAKERLKLMVESESMDHSPVVITRMKKRLQISLQDIMKCLRKTTR